MVTTKFRMAPRRAQTSSTARQPSDFFIIIQIIVLDISHPYTLITCSSSQDTKNIKFYLNKCNLVHTEPDQSRKFIISPRHESYGPKMHQNLSTYLGILLTNRKHTEMDKYN